MEVSQTVEKQVRVRVAMSGDGAKRYVHHVADLLERRLSTKGSAVIPQEGRWAGKVEQGYVVEVCTTTTYTDADYWLRAVGATLQDYVGVTGLTFYVTAEEVLAMEVF